MSHAYDSGGRKIGGVGERECGRPRKRNLVKVVYDIMLKLA